MSRQDVYIRCDGLRPDRRVCMAKIPADDAIEGWQVTADERMHICPAHFEAVEAPNVWPDDVVLIRLPDLTFKQAAVTAPVGDGVRVVLDGGSLAVPRGSLVVLSPHAGD